MNKDKKITDERKKLYSSTENIKKGERVLECRLLAGFSRETLAEKVSELPENGSRSRSAKQLGYIETGARSLSPKYARLLAKVLGVREEYLLFEDDVKTDAEYVSKIVGQQVSRQENIEQLVKLHGYFVEDIEYPPEDGNKNWGSCCRIQYPPDSTEAEIIERARNTVPEPVVTMRSSDGLRKMEYSEYHRLLQDIDDYIEMRLALVFRGNKAL